MPGRSRFAFDSRQPTSAQRSAGLTSECGPHWHMGGTGRLPMCPTGKVPVEMIRKGRVQTAGTSRANHPMPIMEWAGTGASVHGGRKEGAYVMEPRVRARFSGPPLVAAMLVVGVLLGALATVALTGWYRLPSCPHEDTCSVDYRDGAWYIAPNGTDGQPDLDHWARASK